MLSRVKLLLCKRHCSQIKSSGISNSYGYTLIEIIIGIVVFSIMLLAIFRMFAFSTMENKRTNDLDELYTIAQRSMEFIKNNVVVSQSTDYQELIGYTTDTATLNRFTVIYKAQEIDIPNPAGEVDITDTIPTRVVNYNVDIEVYFSRDKLRLGSIGADSKVSAARSLNIPIIYLNSQLTQYENKEGV